MITFRDYLKASTLEEAWKSNQKRANRIMGGMGWMKMSRKNLGTIIDINGLGLDMITETEDSFEIGAMVTLRQLETNGALQAYFGGAFREAVRHIVGTQFRNCATIGGSLWLQPGFSDPLTLLLALDTQVSLYVGEEKTEKLPLTEFLDRKKDNSILTGISVKKDGRRVSYQSFRNTETDFPVLTAAVAKTADGRLQAAVGARPAKAKAIAAEDLAGLKEKAAALSYAGNIRGSAEYREMLAGVLLDRAVKELEEN